MDGGRQSGDNESPMQPPAKQAPMNAPTPAMKRAARRAVVPVGADHWTKRAYRDGAMLREYWSKQK